MKKNLLAFLTKVIIPGLIVLVILTACFQFINRNKRSDAGKRKQHELLLNKLNRSVPTGSTKKMGEKGAADEPDIAAFNEFLMTFDPATGTVPRERLVSAIDATRALSSLKQGSRFTWQGYSTTIGGRTRTIMYDPNDPTHKKVWAGGVTGGLWFNNNIQDPASVWHPVGDFWSTLSIRCLAYDPAHPQTFYAGSGEVETAMQTYRESSGLGFGIGRSDDGGLTWYHIPGTEQFAYVTDIVIRIENDTSVIYAGVASGLYKGKQQHSMPSDGLFRSKNGGASWQQVMPIIPGSTVPYCVSDIALGADNRLYVGTRPNLDNEGAAVLLWSDNGTQWNVNSQYQAEILASGQNNIPGRVVLATAPSDPNVVYALIASGYVNSVNGFNYFNCFHILRSANKGVTWVKKPVPTDITSGNNFATIAWHALDAGVDPNNANQVVIGGLDAHISSDGGSNWHRVSDWSLMYQGGGPTYLHADQHAIVFKPGSSMEILFGTDGGVFYTGNGNNFQPTFETRNTDFNTLQFYTCAIHPIAGSENFYGGLQDNGTLYYSGTPLALHDMIAGGDGACCFFDETDGALSIASYYYNNYTIFENFNYMNTVSDWSSGTFVSPADLDYKNKILYCNAVDYIGTNSDQILRLENLYNNSSGTFVSLNTGSSVFFSALKYSPYSPAGKSTLFVGSESGRLFRVAEAQTNTPTVTEIGGPLFPAASISSIAIGTSENTLMVTFSNYGVASVWQSNDGGQTWFNIEGNLPDMPVRWAIYHPQNNRQAMLATETGVWECATLDLIPTVWTPVIEGMAKVRVDMLQVRKSDNTVLAATHGRGLFTTTWDVSTGAAEKQGVSVKVSPNPSSGLFRLSFNQEQAGPVTILVNDLAGSAIYRRTIYSPAGHATRMIDLAGHPDGTFIISMKSGGVTLTTQKIVVCH